MLAVESIYLYSLERCLCYTTSKSVFTVHFRYILTFNSGYSVVCWCFSILCYVLTGMKLNVFLAITSTDSIVNFIYCRYN